ncbi:MAG: FHA domain-containing protein [Ruminococcus sp.]|nr:FHA domain-containing protein [Ruminococcus sp.]
MKTVKCPNVIGHYYDADKFDTCPHCLKAAGKTPLQKGAAPQLPPPAALPNNANEQAANEDKDKKHSGGLLARIFGGHKEEAEEQPTASAPEAAVESPAKLPEKAADAHAAQVVQAVQAEQKNAPPAENSENMDKTMKVATLYEEDSDKTYAPALSEDDAVTVASLPAMLPPEEQFPPQYPQQQFPPQAPIDVPSVSQQINRVAMSGNIGDIKTIAHCGFEDDIEPVVGWLAVATTADKGASFEIKSGRTTIGRSGNGQIVDVSLERDASVSRGAQATITYDSKKVRFLIKSNDANTLVYVNDELLMDYTELNPYDKIQLGDSELIFIPLCSDKFTWND